MDPIAHTLAGATMAQTGLKRLTPLATATLVIGANLPDIDAVVTVLGSDTSLLYRRGLTHGVVAFVVLPVMLTLGLMAYDRFIRRRKTTDKDPIRPGVILGLSYLGMASHLFLDWLNTYGVRLLMPFDGRWFYGDTLFIIDPWVWLLLAASVVFAHSHSLLSQRLWIVLGITSSALVTLAPVVPAAAKVVWWVGVGVILALRWRGITADKNRRVAVLCLVVVCLYLAAMMLGNKWAQQEVDDWLDGDIMVTEMMTGPVPANPFSREVLAVSKTHYHGVEVRWFKEPRYSSLYEPVPIEEPDEVVKRALEDESIRGFTNWMRYPVWEVQEVEDGHQVIIRDLRYVAPDEKDSPGIGMTTVVVDS